LQNEFDTAEMKHYGLHVGDDIMSPATVMGPV
jgi:hypothetical protein